MKSCKDCQILMVDALYGELENQDKTAFAGHLKDCPICLTEYESLRETLNVMSQKKDKDPGPEFWDSYAEHLEKRINEQDKSPKDNILKHKSPGHRWTMRIISAAAMLIIGFSFGYLYFNKPLTQPIVQSTVSGEDYKGTIRKTANYLEDSKVLILGIVNFDTDQIDPSSMNFSRQKQASRTLIREAVSLKDELRSSGNHRLLELVSELEMILMQICNYEKNLDVPAIDLIKSGVDNQAILLKINLEELIIAAGKEQQLKKDNTKKEIRL